MTETLAEPPRLCIATVSSDSFAEGSAVMFDSFRRTNRWFDGEMLVFADRLSPSAAATLSSVPRLRIVPVGNDLLAALARLGDAVPALAGRLARFHSLEAFRLAGREKVLFCDSDLLFMDDIQPLLAMRGSLLAAPDNPARRGRARDRRSFQDVDRDAAGDILYPTFNAGLMLIDAALAGGAWWSTLLSELDPARWREVATGHTDQVVLNRLFGANAILIDPAYNCVLDRPDALSPEDIGAAKVLHFNGQAKPWRPEAYRHAVRQRPALMAALSHWFAARERWRS